jgi:hypothetical protein
MLCLANISKLINESSKKLEKEIEEDIRRWKHLPCSWISRVNVMEMAIIK